ncbi:hypothetical protein VTG60DRAFT_3710 [Thermothelomyces hinnuleus]
MTRPYYCWSVTLTFRCGCIEVTPTSHACGPDRDGCTTWMISRRAERLCNEHRSAEWGLTTTTTTTSSSSTTTTPTLCSPSLSPSPSSSPFPSPSRSPGTPSQEWSAYGMGGPFRSPSGGTAARRKRGEEGSASESDPRSRRRVELRKGGIAGEGNWEGYYSQRRAA